MKAIFEKSESLAIFWISVRQEYPELSDLVIICLTPFASTHRCESGSSSMTMIQIKTGIDWMFIIHWGLRSDIKPRKDLLVKNKQAHVLH